MTEDILVSVKGLHTLEDVRDEEIELFTAGKYYLKNGKHYILYDEVDQDTKEVFKNRITLRDGTMELQKRGSVYTSMRFERDQKTTSWYHTPFGSMVAGITVDEMQVTESENLLEIKVSYELELNYEMVADSCIIIKAMTRDSGLFRIL